MVLRQKVKEIFVCEICGRVWCDKKYAEFCEGQCLKGTPIKLSKQEIEGRINAYTQSKGNPETAAPSDEPKVKEDEKRS